MRSAVQAIDTWHGRRVYRAQIENPEIAAVVVKSDHTLKVGSRISFAKLSELKDSTTPQWHFGVISRIENDCLQLRRS